jgi:hypothetical protein
MKSRRDNRIALEALMIASFESGRPANQPDHEPTSYQSDRVTLSRR